LVLVNSFDYTSGKDPVLKQGSIQAIGSRGPDFTNFAFEENDNHTGYASGFSWSAQDKLTGLPSQMSLAAHGKIPAFVNFCAYW
jgi:hypothetical protein